jgi:hypothetical protein
MLRFKNNRMRILIKNVFNIRTDEFFYLELDGIRTACNNTRKYFVPPKVLVRQTLLRDMNLKNNSIILSLSLEWPKQLHFAARTV